MLVERGFARLRYSDVAEATGVPTASIQHYFPTIHELRRAGLCYNVREEAHILTAALADLDDPWDQIDLTIRLSIGEDSADRRYSWTLWLEYFRSTAADPVVAADFLEVEALWINQTSGIIAEGVARGMFHLDCSLEEAARELHATIDGYGTSLSMAHDDAEAQRMMDAVRRSARRLLSYTRVSAAVG